MSLHGVGCRDCIDQPYIHGIVHIKKALSVEPMLCLRPCACSFEDHNPPSLFGRVSRLGLGLLLCIPLVNNIVHIALKWFFSIREKMPGERVLERRSHLKLLTPEERQKHQKVSGVKEVLFDESSREATFNPDSTRVALCKVLGNRGQEEILDVREVSEHPLTHCKTYVPFGVLDTGSRVLGLGQRGWLTLSFSSPDHVHICRIDNFSFRKEFRLGSLLVQLAIEKSFEAGAGGKVTLSSSGGSGVFYHKMGFVSPFQSVQERLAREVPIDAGDMYLPEDAIEAWKKKIRENPLFLERF